MNQKWNLQDIRPAEPRRSRTAPPVISPRPDTRRPLQTPSERQFNDADTLIIKDGNKAKKKSILLVSSIIAILVIGIFAASYYVSRTTLIVYPYYSVPTVNAEFTAYPERRDGQLSYEIMTLTEKGERQVKATGQEQVETQAKGFIEIIKTTPGAERLIKNTRFRSPDGLIFRIQESVVVPGAVNDSSGKLVPGTIRAEVFADGVGSEYNLAAGTRFDVPGFQESKLDQLYRAIYAENREAFSGGYKGPRFVIDETELSTAEQSLQLELRDKLLARVQTEQPADFAAFPGAISITYNSLPPVQFGEDLVTIVEEATLQLPLFRDAELASFLAKETVPTYNNQPVHITNVTDLTFSYIDTNKNASNLANETALSFSIIGRPQIVWDYSPDQLKKDLAGKSFTAVPLVVEAHPGIKGTALINKPFFVRSFPEKPEEIVIETKIEEPPRE